MTDDPAAVAQPDLESVVTGLTAEIAARSAGLQPSDLPDDVRIRATHCILDWFGVALAGANEPVVELLVAELSGDGPSLSTVVGHPQRFRPTDAALVNGAAAHALDFDDVNYTMSGHPSTPVLAAALAVGELVGASGALIVCAFVAGYEAECEIGLRCGPELYARGFHTTGTGGTFGAAVAAARVLGLDAADTAVAIGLAATQAAGLRAMFGTMAKPLTVGKAAANGVLAAKLAARGISAPLAALECEFGYAQAHGGHPPRAVVPRPEVWHLRQNLFKFHAACFANHSPVEAVHRYRTDQSVAPEEIAHVVVHATEHQRLLVGIEEPTTGLEAKFSVRHAVAMALAGVDTGAPASYDASVTDPAVLAVRQRVRVAYDCGPAADPHAPTAVDIVLTNGVSVTVAYDVGVPERDLTLQQSAIVAKFDALTRDRVPAARREELLTNILALERVPSISAVMRLAAVGARPDLEAVSGGH